MRLSLITAAFTWCTLTAAGQKTPKHANWQLSDPGKDAGAGVHQAYELLKNKPHKTVVVAVIDIGTDINHEDLKEVIWTNPGEIAGNGIDDDHNGYIDDVHGWNFLGGKNGDIGYEASEVNRQYRKQWRVFAAMDTNNLDGKAAVDFASFRKLRTDYFTEKQTTEAEYQSLAVVDSFFTKVKAQNNGVLDKAGLKKYQPQTELETRIRKKMKLVFTLGMGPTVEEQVATALKQTQQRVKYYYMDADSLRRAVVGDDPDNPNERYYGNNNVIGPEASHGTHTAGIIGAVRGNGKGPDGVANDVHIMVIRAVPWGDERDKDIANAIRYAADNGATVINMSFGKTQSPDKAVVDAAIQYAASKDIVMVHGAGNESSDNDTIPEYPNPYFLAGGRAAGWIEVGATGRKKGKNLVASFSNYGKKSVDIFAPGVDIYSTLPGNTYQEDSGTSMAAPVVAGIAALIRAYFPDRKAEDIKAVLLRTASTQDEEVIVPGTTNKKSLKDISVSGGVINAGAAVQALLQL